MDFTRSGITSLTAILIVISTITGNRFLWCLTVFVALILCIIIVTDAMQSNRLTNRRT